MVILGVRKRRFLRRGLPRDLEFRNRSTARLSRSVQSTTRAPAALPFDVYRLGDVDEMDEIGYEDYFYGEGICLIEWSERIREILPEHPIQITIEKDLEKGFDYRKISVNEQ